MYFRDSRYQMKTPCLGVDLSRCKIPPVECVGDVIPPHGETGGYYVITHLEVEPYVGATFTLRVNIKARYERRDDSFIVRENEEVWSNSYKIPQGTPDAFMIAALAAGGIVDYVFVNIMTALVMKYCVFDNYEFLDNHVPQYSKWVRETWNKLKEENEVREKKEVTP